MDFCDGELRFGIFLLDRPLNFVPFFLGTQIVAVYCSFRNTCVLRRVSER